MFLVLEIKEPEVYDLVVKLQHDRRLVMECELSPEEWKLLRELQRRYRTGGEQFLVKVEKAARALRDLIEPSRTVAR